MAGGEALHGRRLHARLLSTGRGGEALRGRGGVALHGPALGRRAAAVPRRGHGRRRRRRGEEEEDVVSRVVG